jgi:hypothetical protein
MERPGLLLMAAFVIAQLVSSPVVLKCASNATALEMYN